MMEKGQENVEKDEEGEKRKGFVLLGSPKIQI